MGLLTHAARRQQSVVSPARALCVCTSGGRSPLIAQRGAPINPRIRRSCVLTQSREGDTLREMKALVIAPLAAVLLLLPATALGGSLPLTTFADVVVDADHSHVFVTGGPGNSSIIVLDFDGRVVKAITGQPGAAGMALDRSMSTLYVALSDRRRFPYQHRLAHGGGPVLGRARTCPLHACAGRGATSVHGLRRQHRLRLDHAHGHRSQAVRRRLWRFSHRALRTPLSLRWAGFGGSPPIVTVLDVSTDPPTEQISGTPPGIGYGSSNLQDMEVTPDGLSLLVACGAPYVDQVISLTDLSLVAKYPTGAYPSSVAASQDGEFVAGGNGTTVSLFETGNETAVRTYPQAVYPRGLAFSPNGRKIFAVGGSESHPSSFSSSVTASRQPSPSTAPKAR